MDTAVIVAIISLVGTLGGSFGGVLVSSKLTNYRLQQLENKVQEHSSYSCNICAILLQICCRFKSSYTCTVYKVVCINHNTAI